MTGIRKKILFIFYILVIGIILLYVLFPADAVRNHLANRINQNVSQVQVVIGSLRLGFPPALTLKEVTVSKNGAVLGAMDLLKLTPRWLSLFSSRKAFKFKGQTYQGSVSGSGWVALKNKGVEASASGDFSEIRLEQVPALQEKTRIDLTGTLSGTFQIDASEMSPPTANGSIFISDCNLVPPDSFSNIQRLLNIQQLQFQRVEADFDLKGENLEIQNGEFEGTDFSGTVAGSIFFESPIPESEMDLEIGVIPLLSSTLSEINELSIKATGTFENPILTTALGR